MIAAVSALIYKRTHNILSSPTNLLFLYCSDDIDDPDDIDV